MCSIWRAYLNSEVADGFYFDGIPQYVDPRAPKLFSVVGWDDGVVYSDYIGAASEVKPVHLKNPADNTQNMLTIDPKYTWDSLLIAVPSI